MRLKAHPSNTHLRTASLPFQWKFTRDDLRKLLAKREQHDASCEPLCKPKNP
jgi:hypothetical protein